jgi:cytochrome P450
MIADVLPITGPPSTQELPAASPRLPLDVVTSHIARLDLSPTARRQHGDFYSLTIEGQPVVLLTHPDHAQHVFQRPHIYPKALHRGRAIANDDLRLAHLRLLRPQFHRRRLAALCDLMVTTIDEELQWWSTPDSPALDLMTAMSQVTLNVLTRAMFGAALPAATYAELAHALLEIVEHSPGDESAQLLRATPGLHAALAVYDRVFDTALARCRQAEDEQHPQTSLLAMLLDAVDARSGQALTEEQLREEILFIFFVGFENIAAGLAHSFHLLMAHPTALAKLQAEVDEVLGAELPTLESMNRLVYAGMVLQETLRLHPPVDWLSRRAVAVDHIVGHRVPAGAYVMLAAKLYQSDPEFWANPETFEPEHFRPEDAAGAPGARHPCAWLPFGAGQRFCLGKDFAMMEGKLILAMTLQRFDFTT